MYCTITITVTITITITIYYSILLMYRVYIHINKVSDIMKVSDINKVSDIIKVSDIHPNNWPIIYTATSSAAARNLSYRQRPGKRHEVSDIMNVLT